MKRFLSTVLVIGLMALSLPVFGAAVFTDVASNHPHYEAISYLYEQSIIEGYPDNSFRPDQPVNRAEALKIILLGSKINVPEVSGVDIFQDVLDSVWYGRFVYRAKQLNIVKGDDGSGLFRPGDTVNLAEALKILLETTNTPGRTPSFSPYRDVPVNAWFAPYFEYARLAQLLDQQQAQNVFPATPVTRGLLAELIYRHATNEVIVPDGKASYYGEKFHGRTTANGEVFDASGFTAAHLTYAFDTWLKVTNAENGKSVVVRVNDRGPYVSDPDRIIDLSKAAFEAISPLSRGIISVKVELTSPPSESDTTSDDSPPLPQPTEEPAEGDLLNHTKISCPEANNLVMIPANTYENITLDEPIPNHFILDDVLTIRGSTPVNTKRVTAFLIDENDDQVSFRVPVVNGRFEAHARFPDTGLYKLGVLPGESGTSIIRDLRVLKNTCIEEVQNSALPEVTGLEVSVEGGDTVVRWNDADYDIYKLTFIQGGIHNTYILHDLTEWRPIYREFAQFIAGNADLSLRGGYLEQDSILQPVQVQWSPKAIKPFQASQHHEYNLNEDLIEVVTLSEDTIVGNTIKLVFRANTPVRSEGAVILPNGSVKEIELTGANQPPQKNEFDVEVYPASNASLTLSHKSAANGIHFIEVNDEEGLAAVNIPIYVRNQFPLLPSPRDLAPNAPAELGNNLTLLRSQLLELVNKDRREHGLNNLQLDTNLNSLAQFRSDDMVENAYFSHWDSEGRDANDLRANYGIQQTIGENLAKDLNLELAQYGLMRSAIHRSNILSDDWTRVGFGITKDTDGSYIVVQLFSADPIDLDDLEGLRETILDAVNKKRSVHLSGNTTLHNVAQAWSARMADEDFFDFTAPNGDSLVDSVRDAGVNEALGTFIMGNSSFGDALDQIEGNQQLQDPNWTDVGIGIKQDSVGIIKITLVYTE